MWQRSGSAADGSTAQQGTAVGRQLRFAALVPLSAIVMLLAGFTDLLGGHASL